VCLSVSQLRLARVESGARLSSALTARACVQCPDQCDRVAYRVRGAGGGRVDEPRRSPLWLMTQHSPHRWRSWRPRNPHAGRSAPRGTGAILHPLMVQARQQSKPAQLGLAAGRNVAGGLLVVLAGTHFSAWFHGYARCGNFSWKSHELVVGRPPRCGRSGLLVTRWGGLDACAS
jgi:hypothetical protein